jgi:hypothetical protein
MLTRGSLHYTYIFHKYEVPLKFFYDNERFLNFQVSSPQMACTPIEPT